MRVTYEKDNTHRFQTCVDLISGCKAFRHKLELDNRERRLPRWRFRLYIGVIILLEFLFVIISVLLAPQIICGAIQETQSTCRQSVKGAQTLLGVYSTFFFVWGIVVAVLVYSMCRRKRQDVNEDLSRKMQEKTTYVASSPQQRATSFAQAAEPHLPSTMRSSSQPSGRSGAEERHQGVAQEAGALRQVHETGMSIQPNAGVHEHEQQQSGDLGTRSMVQDGPAMTSPSPAPPPYSPLNLQVSDVSLSASASHSAIDSERTQLDDHEIQRMFHARMYPSRQRGTQGRTAHT